VNSAQPIRILLFLVSGKREGEEIERNPSFSALLLSFFPSRVNCHVILKQGSVQPKRNWRELNKNLAVLSSLDAYR